MGKSYVKFLLYYTGAFKLKLVDYQFYWPSWYDLRPWYSKDFNSYQDFCWDEYWFGISFLQFRFHGKIRGKLKRSEEWSKEVKNLLLKDLKAQKYNKVL